MDAPKHTSKQFKKGVSLIEVLVAMFVFTVMIVAMTGVFVTLLHKRTEVRKMQQQTEEFSLAMGYMAKKIRTSDYVSCTNSPVTQYVCTIHEHTAQPGAANDTKFTFDNSVTPPILKEEIGLVSEATILSNVTGGFSIANDGTDKIPRITIHMMTPGKPETSVQTTVSMRSY